MTAGSMFDTSSFRIRYKAPVEKPLLIAAGPVLILAVVATALWSRYADAALDRALDLLRSARAPAPDRAAGRARAPGRARLRRRRGLPVAAQHRRHRRRRSSAARCWSGPGARCSIRSRSPRRCGSKGSRPGSGRAGFRRSCRRCLVVAIEVLLGSLLVLGVRYRAVLVTTGLLVAFFLFLTGRAYWRDLNGIVAGDPESCGCFGNMLDRSPREAFFQDSVLLVPGLLLAALAVPQQHTLGRRVALAWLITAAAVALGLVRAEACRSTTWRRVLTPGRKVEAMCAGLDQERLCLTTILPELSGRPPLRGADRPDGGRDGRRGRQPQSLRAGEREPATGVLSAAHRRAEPRLLLEVRPRLRGP